MGEPGLAVALASEANVIRNMFQFYIHDFTEHWAGTQRGELESDGRFADYPLESYWKEPDRIALLVRVDGYLAGFALLNTHTHSGLPADRNMAEFLSSGNIGGADWVRLSH